MATPPCTRDYSTVGAGGGLQSQLRHRGLPGRPRPHTVRAHADQTTWASRSRAPEAWAPGLPVPALLPSCGSPPTPRYSSGPVPGARCDGLPSHHRRGVRSSGGPGRASTGRRVEESRASATEPVPSGRGSGLGVRAPRQDAALGARRPPLREQASQQQHLAGADHKQHDGLAHRPAGHPAPQVLGLGPVLGLPQPVMRLGLDHGLQRPVDGHAGRLHLGGKRRAGTLQTLGQSGTQHGRCCRQRPRSRLLDATSRVRSGSYLTLATSLTRLRGGKQLAQSHAGPGDRAHVSGPEPSSRALPCALTHKGVPTATGRTRRNGEGTGEDVRTRLRLTQDVAFLEESLLLLPVTTYGHDAGTLSKSIRSIVPSAW